LNPDAILEINAIENFLKTAISYNDLFIETNNNSIFYQNDRFLKI
jgi:hypothetical protein